MSITFARFSRGPKNEIGGWDRVGGFPINDKSNNEESFACEESVLLCGANDVTLTGRSYLKPGES